MTRVFVAYTTFAHGILKFIRENNYACRIRRAPARVGDYTDSRVRAMVESQSNAL
jgi:hypothetical protein